MASGPVPDNLVDLYEQLPREAQRAVVEVSRIIASVYDTTAGIALLSAVRVRFEDRELFDRLLDQAHDDASAQEEFDGDPIHESNLYDQLPPDAQRTVGEVAAVIARTRNTTPGNALLAANWARREARELFDSLLNDARAPDVAPNHTQGLIDAISPYIRAELRPSTPSSTSSSTPIVQDQPARPEFVPFSGAGHRFTGFVPFSGARRRFYDVDSD